MILIEVESLRWVGKGTLKDCTVSAVSFLILYLQMIKAYLRNPVDRQFYFYLIGLCREISQIALYCLAAETSAGTSEAGCSSEVSLLQCAPISPERNGT